MMSVKRPANPLAIREERGSVRTKRAGRAALCIVAAVVCLAAVAAPAWGASSSTTTTTTTRPGSALATLKIRDGGVEYKAARATSYSQAKDGQALKQGDGLKTDAKGLAEINYSDGSYTRLGADTEFTITTLTDKQGARQTKGTLTVGSTWNRAARVSETGGSFELTAGGATAAVEGTLFSVICRAEGGQPFCDFFDIADPVNVTLNGNVTPLTNATKVTLDQGALGDVQPVTREELLAIPFIAGNAFLDEVLKLGGLSEFPPAAAVANPTPPGGGGGGGTGAGTGGAPPTVSDAGDGGKVVGKYPPTGTIVVDNPNVPPGGTVKFSGSGCEANGQLSVLFDGKGVGTIVANANGEFAGSLTIPQTTTPGHHTLTVRGKTCDLSVVINVLAPQAQARPLAFTGSSNHTSTYVLVGAAAVLIGAVLVVGARRRRAGRAAGPPAA
jgi:LPXTG-motif cell wall-anchored protein